MRSYLRAGESVGTPRHAKETSIEFAWTGINVVCRRHAAGTMRGARAGARSARTANPNPRNAAYAGSPVYEPRSTTGACRVVALPRGLQR